MGNSEDVKSVKIERPSSPVTTDQTIQGNQPNILVYPDWAAMQAYYGPTVNIPPYFNSPVAAGHAPHPYMWGPPQHMMPPYAAFYSHGGVYTHPAVAVGPNSPGQGIPSSPAAGTPSSIETPTKSSGNTDQGLVKKLKGFDGLATIGNGNAENAERGAENRLSRSVDTEGSNDGSDGNTEGTNQSRKRSREETSATDGEGKTELHNNPVFKETATSKMMVSVTPVTVAGQLGGPVVSTNTPQPCAFVPSEAWIQNERELKRERRKQSNRESARRSRLRKQAEAEELARRVNTLTSENLTLKSEINQLTGSSEKLRMENATLKEKLKNTQLEQTEEIILNNIDSKRDTPVSTENLLSRVDNSTSNDRTVEEENDFCENKPNTGAKLHQLLDTKPRANAVAAS